VRTEQGRVIRKVFVPSRPENVLVAADYSQIELRVLAHMSGDRNFIRAFEEGRISTPTRPPKFSACR
jgi:DNA polymerase-1